jgi:ketopantoate hydroxymethyltransferase
MGRFPMVEFRASPSGMSKQSWALHVLEVSALYSYIGAGTVLDSAIVGHVSMLLTRTLDVPSIGLGAGHFRGAEIE